MATLAAQIGQRDLAIGVRVRFRTGSHWYEFIVQRKTPSWVEGTLTPVTGATEPVTARLYATRPFIRGRAAYFELRGPGSAVAVLTRPVSELLRDWVPIAA